MSEATIGPARNDDLAGTADGEIAGYLLGCRARVVMRHPPTGVSISET
jgi:hypothetical protein